jgi:hypothetical protein
MAGVKQSNPFVWDDPLLLEAHLGEEERMIRDTARSRVRSAWPRGSGRFSATSTPTGDLLRAV